MKCWYAFPAPRGLKIHTEEDILGFIRDGRIPSYMVFFAPPHPEAMLDGWHLYGVNDKGEAKPCITASPEK